LLELKKQNKQHITESLLTLNTLEVKLQEFTNKEARHKQQKARDLQAIETQRQHLATLEVYNSRKLENEERILEDKFLTTKQEMKRKFIHDLDELKKNSELQIQALNQKFETNMTHVSHVMAGKIGDLQADSRSLRREYDILSLEIKELKERQARLNQEYKKEKTITDANGTDSIEWLEKSGSQEKRNMVVDLEQTVNYLRQTLLESEDKLATIRKQKLANQEALKKAKQKLEEKYQAIQLLEFSTANMESRQRKKIAEIAERVEIKKRDVANEHATAKARLMSEYDQKNEECKELHKAILEAEAELSSVHLSTELMSQRMNDKLLAERAAVTELESQKRDVATKARLTQQAVDVLANKLVALEKEAARLKAQSFSAQSDLMEEENRNQLLEQQIKRLEARI